MSITGSNDAQFYGNGVITLFNSSSNGTNTSLELYTGDYAKNFIVHVNDLPNKNWGKPAMSANGQYQTTVTCANPSVIYTSTNYGVVGSWFQSYSFTSTNGITSLGKVIMSTDGKYQIACTGLTYTPTAIYMSTNYGATNSFSQIMTSTTYPNSPISDIAMSHDGKYITATVHVQNGGVGIIRSTNYGSSFTATNPLGYAYLGPIAMNATGQYQTAMVWYNSRMFVSSNYGVNWTAIGGYPLTAIQPNYGDGCAEGLCITASGDTQYVTDGAGYVCRSTNYGVNWSRTIATCIRVNGFVAGTAIFCSRDGKYVITNNKYYSIDYGVNWIQATTNFYGSNMTSGFTGGAISDITSSGQYIVIGQNDYLYTKLQKNTTLFNNNINNYLNYFKFLVGDFNNTGTTYSFLDYGTNKYDGSLNSTVSSNIGLSTTTFKLGTGSLYINGGTNNMYFKTNISTYIQNGFTLCFWIYINSGTNNALCWIGETSNLSNYNQNIIYIQNYSNKVYITKFKPPTIYTQDYQYNYVNPTYATKTWMHYAFVFNGTNIELYSNGVYFGGANISSGYTDFMPVAACMGSQTSTLTSNQAYYNDVRTYGYALSPSEINYIYNTTY